MSERYEAVFWDNCNGYFSVFCYGFFKAEGNPHSMMPTVEEAKEEYSSNCTYIGLK